MTDWHVGTMGFGYKQWRSVLYPADLPERQQLAYYAGLFNGLEMDSTFYGIPMIQTVERWRQSTPVGFEICPKVPREITHELRLKSADALLAAFLNAMRLLEERLGAIVIQLSPDFSIGEIDGLRGFLALLPEDLRFAVEFRHRSWVSQETVDLLAEHRVCWVAADYIHLPKTFWPTTDFVYLRFLGRHGRYAFKNQEMENKTADLENWLDQVRPHLVHMTAGYAFFNNDYAGYSPATANRFNRLVGLPVADIHLPQQSSLF
ncbi:MAG: DUF72 domain-containing protein [Chloroflexota bacterium]